VYPNVFGVFTFFCMILVYFGTILAYSFDLTRTLISKNIFV